VETIKQQTRMAYGWLVVVVVQSVVAGLAYGLWSVRTLSVTWTAPLLLRYAACGTIQVLYAFAFADISGQPSQTEYSADLWQYFWHWTFSDSGPAVWNSLRHSSRDPAVESERYRRDFKTHLFVGR